MDRPMSPDASKPAPRLPQPKKPFHETTKGRLTIFGIVAVLISTIITFNIGVNASSNTDCDAFGTGSIDDFGTLNVPFTCTQGTLADSSPAPSQTVYFGVCDSGSVANDDLFNMTFNGSVVSSNRYDNNRELVTIGTASVAIGANTAVVQSISSNATPPATYGYGLSTSYNAIVNFLQQYCGSDILNPAVTASSDCVEIVPVRTEGVAPTNGTLKLMVQYGSANRPEGYTLGHWTLQAGQFLNNAPVHVPAPQFARLWWQPEWSEEWYLLPSQYWHNDGTIGSEYGASCSNQALPSYHTAFNKAIPASQVPILNR
ncbi:MAG: hypothetical protein ACPG8W_24495 [Candidatus Promineifilaceae bacterium]